MGDYEKRQGALVHKTANLVGEHIELGAGTRVDAFVTLTGHIKIGRCVHVGESVAIFGAYGFELGDYSGLSPGVKIFTATEDLSGEWLMHPTSPPERRRIKQGAVSVGKHCTVGANSVLLPGAVLEDGACLGSLSMTKARLGGWAIYAGVPAKFIRGRSNRALQLED